ncbi:hypothetical protein GOODEAATRI_031818 [Goodea atripinnis]|uniref:Uncharacterized protein n=1 Tax=Goodea atripinnis TaxID=208336 RepID=A0ABV0NGA7_9TELE
MQNTIRGQEKVYCTTKIMFTGIWDQEYLEGGRLMNRQGGKKGVASVSKEYCPPMMDWSRDDNRLRKVRDIQEIGEYVTGVGTWRWRACWRVSRVHCRVS